MLFYDAYFRKFGIRKLGSLISPPMPSTRLLDLPQGSIYHYLGSNNGLDMAPANNEYMFRDITRQIAMDHVLDNGASLGNPQRHKVALAAFVRQYHTRHHRYQHIKDITPYESAPMTLVVENYGFISLGYKYQRNVLADYYRWYNQQAALWAKMGELAESSARHQFVKFSLPKVLPSMSDLKMASAKMSVTTIHHIRDPEAFLILELWKWLGDYRAESLLSRIPLAKLDKINLIFEESGRYLVLNLGLLNSWREPTKAELDNGHTPEKDAIDSHQLQRRFMSMLMTLFQVRSIDGKIMQLEGESAKKAEGGPATSGDQATLTKTGTALPVVGLNTGTTRIPTSTTALAPNPEDILNPNVDTDEDNPHLSADQERHLEADLAELDRISKAVALKRTEESQVYSEDEAAHPEEASSMVAGAAPSRLPFPVPVKRKELVPIDSVHVEKTPILHDYTSGIKKVLDRHAEQGLISAAESKRYEEMSKKFETIAAPDGKSTMKEFVVIHPDLIKIPVSHAIPDQPTILDKTMLKSSLHHFDRNYIRDVLQKDVAAMVMNIQNAGYCVTDYEVEHVVAITGDYDMYTARITPIEGSASTLRWKLPTVEDDGVFTSNGVRYRMRKQKGDLPFRKIAPDLIAMTSYYGKLFISRSEKKVNDYGNWLRNSVMAASLDDENHIVSQMHPDIVFDHKFTQPRMYSIMAMGFRDFALAPLQLPPECQCHTLFLNFDHTRRESLYGADTLKLLEKEGSLVVGLTDKKDPVVMSGDGSLMVIRAGKRIDLPSIESLLNLDGLKAPDDFAEVKVMNRTIPLGIVLGYEMGLNKLMEMLNITPRRIGAGKRVGLAAHEYSLVFADETLVFQKADKLAALILSGFQEYHRGIRLYSVYEFDRRGVYLNVLETQGASARYLRELDLLSQLFVDPITRELLVEMKEPIEFQELLLRAANLLLTDYHPRVLDASYMRHKGYERLAGAVYSELVKAIRTHNGKPGKSRQPVDLNPYAIWKNISEDPSKSQVKDINPIENLKQEEAVTYSGVGGRNSRSMTKSSRMYDENDMGVISEATVDSSDVAVNTYTSADPQFNSLRGTANRYEIGKTGVTALLSTSALISVGSDRDDPRRVNFVSIQHGHGVACAGYHGAAVRTGYEQVVAHRTGDLFAYTAKKPGKVISLSETGMVVEFDDGEKKGIQLGRRFGNAEGAVIPHEVRASVKLGEKFKVGKLLSYNEGFFEQDFLDPSQVIWKQGVTVRVALMESPLTLEDSSAISRKTADLLRTRTTKTREILIDFKQSVRDLVKLGQALESEDILCIIEDETTSRNDLFDQASLDTLRFVSAQTPQAKVKGMVEFIEVFYHGEKEDMSDSIKALVSSADRSLAIRHRSIGKPVLTGSVDESYRTDGDSLNLDTVAIKIYITTEVDMGVGDKAVFANQMKSVVGHVLEGDVRTESGKEIGAIFGAKSIQARIVHSPDIIGTTTTLLGVLSSRVVKAYHGK